MSKHESNALVLDVVEQNGQYRTLLPEVRAYAKTDDQQITRSAVPIELESGYRWAPWGEADCLPMTIKQSFEKVPIAGSTLGKKIAFLYGNGLGYYHNGDVQEGNTRPSRAKIPKIETFLRKNRIGLRWLIPQMTDYCFFWNTWSEFILSNDKSLITGLYHKSSEHCRLALQNKQTLNIEHLLYSRHFAQGWQPPEEQIARIPLMNWYEEEAFLARLQGHKFAWHSHFPTPGITYYARPFYIGLFRKNGWLDVSAKVPEVVNAMMSNQITLKYQILIPEDYFIIRHTDWPNYSDADKNKHIDALIDLINATLSGTNNVYKSISSLFRTDSVSGKARGQIEIKAVDDKTKKDEWVPSSDKADQQIILGLGMHPSQAGIGQEGGKMSSGSGSDQRESFNSEISLNTIAQDIILEPLQYVAEYNSRLDPDWDVTFFIDHTHHTTTNLQESGLQPSSTTIQPQ